jgi:uncharacterized protein (TIGR03086 family)
VPENPEEERTMTESSHAKDYRNLACRFDELVQGVPNGAWDRASPVPGWTARDVVRHLVEWFPPFLADGAGIELPHGPSVDDDPVGAWRTLHDGVQKVLDDPECAERTLTNPHIGQVPVPEAVNRFFAGDVFMHAWDLARATGQDDTLDPARCEELLQGLEPLDEVLRSSGQYGSKVDVPDGADTQTKLIAFIGRDPYWQPA